MFIISDFCQGKEREKGMSMFSKLVCGYGVYHGNRKKTKTPMFVHKMTSVQIE